MAVKECPVVMAFDDSYVLPALVVMHSARSSTSRDLSFVIAIEPNSLTSASMDLVKEFSKHIGISVSFLRVSIPSFLHTSGHIKRSAYIRLFVPTHLSTPFVYLDSDVILSRGWDYLMDVATEDSTHGVHGVLDLGLSSLRESNRARVVSGGRYLNSGVLVVVPHLLDPDFESKVVSGIQEYSLLGFQWHDQCVLNFVMEGRVGLLSSAYNHQFPKNSLMCSDSPVLHFTGSQKPWKTSKNQYFAFGERRWRWGYTRMLKTVSKNYKLKNRIMMLRQSLVGYG